MRICLAGPVRVPQLASWLDVRDGADELPPGLGQTPVTLLARGLLRRRFALTIVSLDPTIAREEILEGPRLRLCLQPYRPRHRGRDLYRAERRHLSEALRREAPDLVHAHWSYEYALAALQSGSPTLVTVHDWAPTILRWMPDPYRAARLAMFTWATAKARHFTAVSPYMAARVRRWRRVPVHVVPNALEDDAFDDTQRALRQDAPSLMAINDGFVPWKNVGRLLQAHQLVRAGRPAARLVLVGAGHGPGEAAEKWAAERDLTTGVEFRGEVPYDQVHKLLTEADLLVHPSLEESFGMVVLEAMAKRVPVVAGARSGAVPWVLGQGSAGVLTDVTSPRAIATAITELLDDPRRWDVLSRAAHHRAWNTFRLDHVVDGYLRAYERVR